MNLNKAFDKNIEKHVASKWGEFSMLKSLLTIFQINGEDESITKSLLYQNNKTNVSNNDTIQDLEAEIFRRIDEWFENQNGIEDETQDIEILQETHKKFLFDILDKYVILAMNSAFEKWDAVVKHYTNIIEIESMEVESDIDIFNPVQIYSEALKELERQKQTTPPIPKESEAAIAEFLREMNAK